MSDKYIDPVKFDEIVLKLRTELFNSRQKQVLWYEVERLFYDNRTIKPETDKLKVRERVLGEQVEGRQLGPLGWEWRDEHGKLIDRE